MTEQKEAIELFRKECEAIGIPCHVEYQLFENGETVRVTTEIGPMKMAQWEKLYAATARLRSFIELRLVSEEPVISMKAVK
jgi:hypothetical protein